MRISMDKQRLQELAGIQLNEMEGELLLKDRSTFAKTARDLIQGASAKLYKEGQKPTPQAIQKMAGEAANNLHSRILQAIDQQLFQK